MAKFEDSIAYCYKHGVGGDYDGSAEGLGKGVGFDAELMG